MSRRVLHFIDSLLFGGAEQSVLTLLAGTDRSRWDLTLAHHPSPALAPLVDGARALGVPTWAVDPMPPGWEGLRSLPRFVAGVRRLAPAVVHLHLTWPLGCQYALLGALVSRCPAVVATVHLYLRPNLSKRVYAQQRLLSRAVGRYIAVSDSLRTSLVAGLGWPRSRIVVIHNGVDISAIRRKPAAGLRRALCGDATYVVLVPARLAPQKGHRDLLRAAVGVPAAYFLLAGEGPDREALQTLAINLGLGDRVLFLGERRDVPDLLGACDLVVLPSHFEGLPLALVEAMAAGKAVVATQIGGIDELITSGHDGLLVPAGDSDALATAIRSLLQDPQRRRSLAQAASSTIDSHFSAGVMCRRVADVYDELLAR